MVEKLKKYALLGIGGVIGVMVGNIIKSKLPF